jgi:hypothetical protein
MTKDTIYKVLKEYPNYCICYNGEIFSNNINKFLKQTLSNGYYAVNIVNKNGIPKSIRVHRLVAKAFVVNTNPKKYKIVDHIDENKFNNYDNLKWVTGSENSIKGNKNPHNKRSIIQYDENNNFICEYPTIVSASKSTGCSIDLIKLILRGIRKNKFLIANDGKKYTWNYKEIIKKDILPDSAKK